jgi:hypothetical protein
MKLEEILSLLRRQNIEAGLRGKRYLNIDSDFLNIFR